MVKTFKIFFYGTKRLMTLKLSMQHLVLKYYQICPNDDPGVTLTYFSAMSNLVIDSLTFVQGHSDLTLSNCFSSETARPIEAISHGISMGCGE